MLVFLGLKAQVLHHPVKEVLGKLSVLLLGRGATLGDRFVGLHEGVGELRGGLVYPLLALLVMNSLSSSLRCFPLQLRCTVVVRAQLCMSWCSLALFPIRVLALFSGLSSPGGGSSRPLVAVAAALPILSSKCLRSLLRFL